MVPVTEGVPFLDQIEPEDCYLKWDVTLHADCDRAAIDDVFMFVQDEMKLTLSPVEQTDAAAPAPLFQLLDEEPPAADAPAVVTADVAAGSAAQELEPRPSQSRVKARDQA